ncbi:transglycosylase domain-containing protein [Streptomyces catenulae]|uniref:Transglycosylase domain-containing protein n=1 Tax=Streptomyces catenulae TaxID=66875 RepID=A0ABV2Z7Y5_9ACTN|nr:transglycosylase domain-containing protein [Streptomyces catenulae]
MSEEPHGPENGGPRQWGPRPATPAATGKGAARRRRRTGWRRLFPTWRMLLGTGALLVLLVGGALVAGYLLVDIPAANSAARAQSNVYLYADGSELARDGDINRENVALSQIPRRIQRAVLAAEDRDFHTESAVDPAAMLRAAWNTATGKGKQSGSTITQQYVKNYYLGQEQTLTRKAKEFFIAIKLDREESKDKILEGYLNTSYYGRNAYGIQAASQAYYGKNVDQLSTGQGAYLAALLNAPSAYDVTAHPENRARVLARWKYVLNGMVKEHWLSAADRDAMTFPDPLSTTTPAGLTGQRGYVVKAVTDYLTDHHLVDEDTLRSGGYRITTTLERHRQDALGHAVKAKLTGRLSDTRPVDAYVRAGGASIDPATGRVVALYGGTDYAKQYVNSATRRDYQVGSVFKPLVFASAVQNRSVTQSGARITPNTPYDGTNKRMTVQRGHATGFAPANEDNRSYGQITVTAAMDKSVNAVFAQMGIDVGPAKVKDTAVALGVPEDAPGLASAQGAISLGTATPSVLDMAQVYATLAHHGRLRPYTLVDKVTKDGRELTLPHRPETTAVGRSAADTTTSMLRNVVEGGTATAAQGAGRPAAGKTGTAEDDKAAWFAGYTPELATVVAVLGQNPKTAAQEPLYGAAGLPRVNGGGFPAQIWADYTAAALRGKPVRTFDLKLEPGAQSSASPNPSASGASPSPSGSAPAPGGTAPTGGPQRPNRPGGRPTAGPPPGGPGQGGGAGENGGGGGGGGDQGGSDEGSFGD